MFVAADYLQMALIGVPLVLLAFGIPRTIAHARRGGLTRGLARLVLDPLRVRRFLIFITVVIASFLSLGLFVSFEIAYQSQADWIVLGMATSFFVGCLGVFFLIVNGLPAGELSLHEEMRMGEEHPEVLEVVAESEDPPDPAPPKTMYVVPPAVVANRPMNQPRRGQTEPQDGPGLFPFPPRP